MSKADGLMRFRRPLDPITNGHFQTTSPVWFRRSGQRRAACPVGLLSHRGRPSRPFHYCSAQIAISLSRRRRLSLRSRSLPPPTRHTSPLRARTVANPTPTHARRRPHHGSLAFQDLLVALDPRVLGQGQGGPDPHGRTRLGRKGETETLMELLPPILSATGVGWLQVAETCTLPRWPPLAAAAIRNQGVAKLTCRLPSCTDCKLERSSRPSQVSWTAVGKTAPQLTTRSYRFQR